MTDELYLNSTETLVIGGGQSGLATSYHLKQLGLDHVILDENEHVGLAWRDRWESLRLFTPGKYDSLPGMPYPGRPRSLPGKDDIADYLESYAARFELPLRTGVKVRRIVADGTRYLVEAGDAKASIDVAGKTAVRNKESRSTLEEISAIPESKSWWALSDSNRGPTD